jgi:phytoene/squalene synthetase
MSEAPWRELDDLVAHADPDRYVAALFASPGRRRGLIALYAFNHEVARIREIVHEPLVGHIRLGWWREQIAAIYERRAVTMPLVLALRDAIDVFALPRTLFDSYLDARALDLAEAPFADEAALEGYTGATAGSLMQLAARVTGATARADAAARHAAIAFAYAGFIRALGFDAAHRFCRLPLDWLEAEGLNPEDVFAAKTTAKLRTVVERLAETATKHARAARPQNFPTAAIAALAPAALAGVYIKRAMSQRDLFGQPVDLSQTERVTRIALAALTWRI